MLGKRERLSTQLARQLARKISTHAYPPGEKIPTEAELCTEYGVSRTVVREAIASMRAEGLLESRQGVGVFVSTGMRRLPFALVSDADGRLTDILQILELRLSVEVEGAGLAAERHSAAGLRTIKARLRDIDKELRTATGDRGQADFELHVAIARATSNPYFEKFLAFIGPVIIPRERFGALRDDRLSDQQYHAELQAEHGRVVDAIASRDVAAARDAMRSHLSAALMRYRAHY